MSAEKDGIIVILSSPSGAGKTTLCKLLTKRMKNMALSISYTSRNKRLNEIDGKDYYFVTKNKFKELDKKNFFDLKIKLSNKRKLSLKIFENLQKKSEWSRKYLKEKKQKIMFLPI